MLAFGWYMHPNFGQRRDFPFNKNLRPIFVSFHINQPQLLTPAAIEYLRANGPIGCRDWTTTFLLLSSGVDAYFSGCLTTTADNAYPPKTATPKNGRHLYVDSRETPKNAEQFFQGQKSFATRPFNENLVDAWEKLHWYRADFEQVTTSRLHSYLPSRSIGIPVTFLAKNPADVRFEGLIGISGKEFNTMRERLRDRIGGVIQNILSGADEATVRAEYRKACQSDVDLAKNRFAELGELKARSIDGAAIAAQVRSSRCDYPRTVSTGSGTELHVEVSLDGNLRHQLDVVLDSVVAHTTRPLHIYVLSRDHTKADH